MIVVYSRSVRAIALFLAVAAIVSATAFHPAEARHKSKNTVQSYVPNFASMVVEAETGRVIESVNADIQNHPASLTKIMTLYLLFDALDSGRIHLSDPIVMSSHAAAQAPSKLGLRPGQSLTVEQAILAIVTRSANDVAVAVAERLGGTEQSFSAMMTAKAHRLGMSRTTFLNASGLPNRGQLSTAHDMTVLARAMLRDHPREYHYFSTRQFVFGDEVINTHNHLLSTYEGADGIKTGFVAASGFNLVASARRQGRRLIGVVFGGRSAPQRDRQMATLLDAGFATLAATDRIEMASAKSASTQASDAPTGPLANSLSSDNATQTGKIDLGAEATAEAQGDADEADAAPVMRAMAKNVPPGAHDVAVAAAVGAADRSWGIQIGSFGASAKAEQAVANVVKKLGKVVADAKVSIVASRASRHSIYRARLVGLSERDAYNACLKLTQRHSNCLVIKPGVSVAAR
jgi:D-alanyl-D-alanine carboxypeptidase